MKLEIDTCPSVLPTDLHTGEYSHAFCQFTEYRLLEDVPGGPNIMGTVVIIPGSSIDILDSTRFYVDGEPIAWTGKAEKGAEDAWMISVIDDSGETEVVKCLIYLGTTCRNILFSVFEPQQEIANRLEYLH